MCVCVSIRVDQKKSTSNYLLLRKNGFWSVLGHFVNVLRYFRTRSYFFYRGIQGYFFFFNFFSFNNFRYHLNLTIRSTLILMCIQVSSNFHFSQTTPMKNKSPDVFIYKFIVQYSLQFKMILENKKNVFSKV